MTLKNNIFKWIFIVVFVMFGLSLLVCGCSKNRKDSKGPEIKLVEKKERDNDWNKLCLEGRVKSIKEISYDAIERFGEINKGEREYDKDKYIIFNDKGNKIEENTYNSDGKLEEKYIFKYDEEGNKIEKKVFDRDEKMVGKYIFKYNDEGIMIKRSRYFDNGKPKTKTTWQYYGDKVEENTYWPRRRIYSIIYKYNDKGNKIEGKFYDDDERLSSSNTLKYNEKGNVIEENIYNPDGSFAKKKSYEYFFDKKDNWIKKIYFRNEFPRSIIERKIEYF